MKAVIWTDAFQSFIMIGGMIAIVITVCSFLVIITHYIYLNITFQYLYLNPFLTLVVA